MKKERAPLSCGKALFRKQIVGRIGIALGFHNIERVRISRLGPPETEEGHDSLTSSYRSLWGICWLLLFF